jgi:ubiquinol-cytochrome c reductase cytochrome b subunit
VISFLVLGYLGTVPSNVWGQFPSALPIIGGGDIATFAARIFTIIYFLFFILMPIYSKKDKTKRSERVTMQMKKFIPIILLLPFTMQSDNN